MEKGDHTDIDELLSDYIDGVLSPSKKAQADALLARSKRARNHLRDLLDLQQVFRKWKPVVPDAFFLSRLQTRLAQDHHPGRVGLPWRVLLSRYAVAAMGLLTLGGVAFLKHDRQIQSHSDVETFLSGFLDHDIAQVVAMTESDVSKDAVLNLILTERVR
jgi:anti-sigma factor RsiW